MKCFKKKVLVFTLLILSTLGLAYGQDQPPLELFINGSYGTSDILVKEGVTMIPLRISGELLDAGVLWKPDTKTIEIAKKDKYLIFHLDQKIVNVNGVDKALSNAPYVHYGVIYVPFRAFLEHLGASVTYKNYGELGSYIHAVDPNSPFYKHLENLKSSDLSIRRLAMMEAPRLDQFYGTTSTRYIFPLNELSNYFFVETAPSEGGAMSLAYFEMENGFAIKKWNVAREYKVSTGKHPLLNYLGDGPIQYSFGSFPKNISSTYVAFRNVALSQSQYKKSYVENLFSPSNVMDLINERGVESLPFETKGKILVAETLKGRNYFYLAQIDESRIIK